jgi:DeoR/GlpR family transcriptional regulator of sugar metabolism
VNASVLAIEFSTSEDTIRRDLRDLAAQGFCQRVYGSAVLRSAASTPITVSASETQARKEALGRGMSKLLQVGQFIFIDGVHESCVCSDYTSGTAIDGRHA